MAKRYGISVDKLFEELSTTALAEFDVETRFRVRAGRGSIENPRVPDTCLPLPVCRLSMSYS